MAKFIEHCGVYSVYELTATECRQHGRVFPTFAAWLSSHDDEIGNMVQTENEAETIEEMREWCHYYS